MAKNMIRKSLALGSGLALIATGFSGGAAFGAGTVNGFVTLVPDAGTTYSTLVGQKLDLAANFSTAANNGTKLKFLVTDPNQIVRYDIDGNAITDFDTLTTIDQASGTNADVALNSTPLTVSGLGTATATLTFGTAAVSGLEVGDVVNIAATVAGTFNGSDSWTAADKTLLERDHKVTAVVDAGASSSFSIVIDDSAGNFSVITSSATFTAIDITEKTDGDALDSAADLLLADFGKEGISGVDAEKTDGSAGRNTDGSFIVDTNDTDDAGADQILRLVSSAAGSVTVTAWIDSDDDNVIDSNEYASDARTVTFVAVADATFTTTFAAPATGTSTSNLIAFVSIAPDINIAQFASGDVEVDFGKNGSGISGDLNLDAAYDSTTKLLKATGSDSAGGGDIYYAEAQYGANNSLVTTANFGGKVYGTSLAGTFDVATGGVAKPTIALSENWNGTNARTGTTAIRAVSEVKEDTSGDAAPAGVSATVTITKSVLASGSTVVAGGKTLASTDTSISYETTTNADGEVVVDMVATGAKNDSVTIKVSVLDSNGAGADSYEDNVTDLTVAWADAALASSNEVIELATYGDANTDGTTDAERSVAKGGSMTLNYMVRDSFGAPFSASGYRLAITSGSVTGGGSVSGFASVVNGMATFSFTDNTLTSTGKYTISADLEKVNSDGDAYAAVVAGSDLDIVVNVGTAAAATVTAPTNYKAGDTKEGLELEALVTQDARKIGLTFPYTGANGHSVNGVVKASTGAGIPGQAVTISAPGIGFATDDDNSDNVYSVGSITVYTDSSGAYGVDAFSNVAGSHTFTITSGSASTTHAWTWEDAGELTGADWDLTGVPSVVDSGRNFQLSALLVDKYGNPVTSDPAKVSISWTGPFFTIPSTLPSATDANGKATFGVIPGGNDNGTYTVTFTYAGADGNLKTSDDVTVSKSVTIGSTYGTLKAWTVDQGDGTAKVYVKFPTVGDKVRIGHQTGGSGSYESIYAKTTSSETMSGLTVVEGVGTYIVRTIDLDSGTNRIRVTVGDNTEVQVRYNE